MTPATSCPVGSVVYYRGEPVTIVGEPYALHGAEWQDATLPDGRTVCLPTPAAVGQRDSEHREAHQRQQAAFRRVRESQEAGR